MAVSHDAGRFVCNWIYFRSLQLCAQLRAGGHHVDALFVHFPLLERMPAEEQFECLLKLLELLPDPERGTPGGTPGGANSGALPAAAGSSP